MKPSKRGEEGVGRGGWGKWHKSGRLDPVVHNQRNPWMGGCNGNVVLQKLVHIYMME